jgi:hypothetical protein
MNGGRIERLPVVFVGEGQEWQRGFAQMGYFLGFLISDLYTKSEYEKWRNKMLTASEKKTIGKDVYWKDEETGMWYPQIDLPPDLPIDLRIRFLQQLKVMGRSDISQLEKEEDLRQTYRTLTRDVLQEVIRKGQDPGFLPFLQNSVLPALLLANQAPNFEDKIDILKSVLEGIREITTSSKITVQDKERGLRIETRTQPVRKSERTTKKEKEKKEETIAIPLGRSDVIAIPEIYSSPFIQREIERRFQEAIKRGEIVPSWMK